MPHSTYIPDQQLGNQAKHLPQVTHKPKHLLTGRHVTEVSEQVEEDLEQAALADGKVNTHELEPEQAGQEREAALAERVVGAARVQEADERHY